MIPGHEVRLASEDDLDAIMTIFEGRRDWLRESKFSDQWARAAEWRQLLLFLIRHGQVWVLVARGVVLGTVTIGTAPDPGFWSDLERRQPAVYISRLATDVAHKGQELGRELLDWVGHYAARRGVGTLRLDTLKTSTELQEYYAARGWRHLRTVDIASRQSGSLFERTVEVQVDVDPPTGQFAALRWPPAL